MRLLLDTHIAVWAVSADKHLPDRWIDRISDPANVVAVSMASLWEIAIKRPLQRGPAWDFGMSAEEAMDAFRAAMFDIVNIEIGQLVALQSLPLHHRDPFDRILVATAHADTYRLITTDRALTAYGDQVIVI